MNLLILGPGRTGKTTLSLLLHRRLPHSIVIHTDALRAAFMRGLPKTFPDEILNYEYNNHYQTFLYEFLRESVRQDPASPLILEGSHLTPDFLHAHPLENCKIIFLGHGSADAAAIFQMLRRNDTPRDWSYTLSDDELMAKCAYFAGENQKIRTGCAKYGFSYADTSVNRADILKQISASFPSLRCDQDSSSSQ